MPPLYLFLGGPKTSKLHSFFPSTDIHHVPRELSSSFAPITEFSSLKELLSYLISLGHQARDHNAPIIIFIPDNLKKMHPSRTIQNSSLSTIPHSRHISHLLDVHFPFLPLITVTLSPQLSINNSNYYSYMTLVSQNSAGSRNNDNHISLIASFPPTSQNIKLIKSVYHENHKLIESRLSRMCKWIGLGPSKDDYTFNFSSSHSSSLSTSTILDIDFRSLLHCSQIRCSTLKRLVGTWSFHAPALSYDELLLVAFHIFSHALSSNDPEIQALKISENNLFAFLFAVRDSYHAGNPFHNFRHAIDVLQVTFYVLLSLKVLDPYPRFRPFYDSACSKKLVLKGNSKLLVSTISPKDALALLIAAIGHDVAHPGVTNAFLVSNNTPIARLFNDKSVLESYHAASFSKILDLYWHATQMDKEVRDLINESILATDMALHFEYVNKVTTLKKDISGKHKGNSFSPSERSRIRSLICSLIIKCADISNPARPLDISLDWAIALQREFSEIFDLEVFILSRQPDEKNTFKEMLPENNPGKEPGELVAKGQLFFINTFASGLFQSVAGLLPPTKFMIDQTNENMLFWKRFGQV